MTAATLRQLTDVDGRPVAVVAARLHPEARPPYHQPRTDGLHLRPAPEHARLLAHQTDLRVRGPNGRTLCCWCWTEIPKGRQCWCSDDCVREYKLNHDWATARAECRRRDAGVCRLCGVDVAWLRAAWEAMRPAMDRPAWRRLGQLLSGLNDPTRDWWEADHIQARADGGPDHPDNLRLLCIPSHRRRTRLQAAERAARRRAAKAQETAMTTAPAPAPPPPLLIAGRVIPGMTLAAEMNLIVPVDPAGTPRLRFSKRGVPWTPDTADKMKKEIHRRMLDAMPALGIPLPWRQAVRVSWTAYFAREKRQNAKKGPRLVQTFAAGPKMPDFAFPHLDKPDVDNIQKAVLDVMKHRPERPRKGKRRAVPEHVGVYADDCQVFSGAQDRLWVARGHGPGLIVWVEFITCPWMPKLAKKKGV